MKTTTKRIKVTDAARKNRPCAACGEPVGLATIVAGGDYPDSPLCFGCGRAAYDSAETVWETIRARAEILSSARACFRARLRLGK